MLFTTIQHTMLHNSIFAVFAALAAPGLGPAGELTDDPIAVEPGEEDAENGESSRSDEADEDRQELGLLNVDGVDERQGNPHTPKPQSPACKKKGKNEPDGCPGPR